MTASRIPSVEGGIQPTLLTAKGDLLTASATSTVTNLPVGADGQTLVANSASASGLQWQSVLSPYAAGKNKIINGDFGIWQRGTTFSPTTVTWTYTSDRFQCYYGFSAGTATVARQTFTPGTAPVAGYEGLYYLRFTAATTGTSNVNIKQVIENVQTFAGQTVTFSFWAKSSGSRNIDIFMRQNFGSGGSASVDSTVLTITTTTAWQRFTYTTTLASISGKTIGTNSGLEIWPATSATVTGGETVDFWGWQVEAGSVATAFQTATGTIQGELAACRRYLPTIENTAATAQDSVIGYALAANYAVYYYGFDVIARVPPTGITATGTIQGYGLNTAYTFTPAFNSGTPNGVTITAASGVTIVAGQGSRIILGAGAKILFTGCEL